MSETMIVGKSDNSTVPFERSQGEESLLVDAAENVWNGSDERVKISIAIGEKLGAWMANQLPDAPECAFITDSDIRHIKRKHGSSEAKRGQQDIAPEDFAYIPIVLNEFDSCEHSDTDRLGNKRFLVIKRIRGTVYLVLIQRGKRKLQVKTMWKEDRSGASC